MTFCLKTYPAGLFPALVVCAIFCAALPGTAANTNSVALLPQCYTNHAGHTIAGELVSADANSVTLRLPGGSVRKVPLAAFPKTERERIGIDSGTLPIPPAVAEAFERCRQALQRLDVLVAAGQQSDESAQQSRLLEHRAVLALLKDLEKQGQLSPAATAYFSTQVPDFAW